MNPVHNLDSYSSGLIENEMDNSIFGQSDSMHDFDKVKEFLTS